MSALRTKSIGTKVTDAEYARLEALSDGRTLSEWTREILLNDAHRQSTDQIVLAELLALRTIVVNLHFALARGETLSAESFQRLIDRADQDKLAKAQARLADRPRNVS